MVARFLSAASRRVRAGLVCLLVLVAATTHGRAVPRQSGGPDFSPVGLQADRGYFSELPWERVDMVNGNLIISFTDLVLPGNAGMDLRFVRQYSAGGGWQFGLEGIPILVAPGQDDPLECCDYPVFSGVGLQEKSFPENGQTGSAPVYLTRQFWRYTWATGKLEFPNGWVGTYVDSRLVELKDPFQNSVTFAYTGPYNSYLHTVTQYLGNDQVRTVTYEYSPTYPHLPTSMAYAGRAWSFTWPTQFAMTALQPPAGPAWGFAYTTQTSQVCTGSFPATVNVTTPYGALVQYEFAVRHVAGTVSPPECHAAVSSRTISGSGLDTAVWLLNIPLTFAGPQFTKVSSVTTPLGRVVTFTHDTHYSGDMGIGLSAEFLTRKEIGGAALVERTPTVLPLVGALTQAVVSRQDITVDGVLHRTAFEYGTANFADYHRPFKTTETNGSHPFKRETTRTFDYNFGPRILDRVNGETLKLYEGATLLEERSTASAYDDATGFQTSRTEHGITTTFEPGDFGNLFRETGAIATTFSYTWGALQDTTTPMYTISRAINPDGTLASETRGGQTTAYTYDAIGRPEIMDPPEGANAVTNYDDTARTVTVCRGGECTVTAHDNLGRPTSVTNPAGVTTMTKYDKDGRKTFDGYPGGGQTDGDTFTHDALNRVTQICHPGSSCRGMSYGANSVTITDEEGRVTIQRFRAFGDPFNRLLVGLRDAECNAPECEWRYEYTALGALKKVDAPEGPDRVWNYNYGGQHILGSDVQPESGTTEYRYDVYGRLDEKEDANDITLRHLYDPNSRLSRIERLNSTEYVEFAYDASDNRTRVKTPDVDSTFTYDGANRLTTRTDVIGSQTFVTRYSYDDNDHLRQIDYPSGRQVFYTPDAQGRIVSVTGPGVTFASGVQYHPSGAISALTFGNGTTESVEFDNRHRPDHLQSGPAANRLDLTYTYDEVGNVTNIADPRPGFSSSYLYDDLDRLTTATELFSRGYEYDRLGNRTLKIVGTGNVTYRYDDPDTKRLTSITGAPEAATLTYDSVGNTTADGTGTYTWTAFNLMATAEVSGQTTTYTYDGESQRKKKQTPQGVRYYIHGPGGQLIAEYRETAGGAALVREYIYLGTKLVASSTREEPPTGGRVTSVMAAPQSQPAGTSITVTVAGASPCSTVNVNFGDGTTTPYTIAAPYELPLVVTHTYASPGAYTITASGDTGASGACLGAVSTPLEVTSGNVVDNGDFSQVDGNGIPIGWGVYTQGGSGYWNATSGVFNFYRTDGMTQAVTLQYTGLALPAGAPLEVTFRMGNSDTVRKRLTVIVHSSTFDDLALCTFWLDPQQALNDYAMRMHSTIPWADATASFYAADVNAQGSTGAYQLDDVTLTYRPTLSSAKTDCVDPLAPTTGGWVTGNMLANAGFENGTTSWTPEGALASQVVNTVLEFHRTGSPAPAIRQFSGWAAAEDQRIAATFELGNTSSTRQRVTITLKDGSGPDFTNCIFWLAPNAPRQFYAMTGYASLAWASPGISVEPVTSSGSLAWLQFDTATMVQTTQAVLGTECFEPGSFVVEGGAPVPAPEPDAGSTWPVAFVDPSTSWPVDQFASGPNASAPPAQAVTVSVMGTGTGTVTSSPGGITCGNYYVTCTGWFAEGAMVTLTATPDAGQTFVGWTGACTGTGPCEVSVIEPQSVGALFGAAVQFYHLDVLGSVRMITDANGTVVIRQDYLAFGEDTTGVLTGDPRRFTGKELDPETALQYFGARYYRSESGRFTSVDPAMEIGENSLDPQRWNRYHYVRNSPLRFTDPDGRNPFLIAALVIGIIWEHQATLNAPDHHAQLAPDRNGGDLLLSAARWASGGGPWRARGPGPHASMGPRAKPTPPNAAGSGRPTKVRIPRKSGKEAADDIPDWAKGEKPFVGENGRQFATRVMDAKYGEGKYKYGAGTEFSKIQKFGDRGFMDPPGGK